jgi:hypothetical protein
VTDLHNNHNVYILGAGFSKMRGLPLISDFMLRLRDCYPWLIANERHEEAHSIQKVLQFRLESTATTYRVRIDLENIEELFSLAAAADDRLSQDIKIAIAATLDYCAVAYPSPETTISAPEKVLKIPVTVPRQTKASTDGRPPYLSFSTYDFMAAALLGLLNDTEPRSMNSILTFNYDLLVDEALCRLRTPFDYGFEQNSFLTDSSATDLGHTKGADVALLKLHGSVNWALADGHAGPLTVYKSYENVRRARAIPELVPPTWRKSFTGPLSGVWSHALKRISQATRVIVIGFSMPPTDVHFKYLLAAGLRENVSLREIVFVNPDSDTIAARSRELFGDLTRRPHIRILPIGTSEFTNQGTLDSHVWSIARPMHPDIQIVNRPM